MKRFFILLLSSSLAHSGLITMPSAQEKIFKEKVKSWWNRDVDFIDALKKGEVVSWADVEGDNKRQAMQAKVIGLHPRTCLKGLKKISRYEDYPQHMSFVTQSLYNESTQLLRLTLDHTVLPYPMILGFKIPRIVTPSTTPFVFPDGIFQGLTGRIEVMSLGSRCVYFLQAEWKGPSTGLPNVVVSTFAQTLIKIGLEHLIRISSL